jgi:predicted transcriptional regulator
MTLNLSEREMAALDQLATEMDMSKTAVMRQALRLYQLVHERIKAGETMTFSGDKERIALFVGPGLGGLHD